MIKVTWQINFDYHKITIALFYLLILCIYCCQNLLLSNTFYALIYARYFAFFGINYYFCFTISTKKMAISDHHIHDRSYRDGTHLCLL